MPAIEARFAAFASLLLLVGVAAVKTILTKLIFLTVPTPVAYSLLSTTITAAACALLLPLEAKRLQCVRRAMLIKLTLVCVAVAVDLGLSNVAIWLLPLQLQQAIAATIPAATITLESLYRRRRKPLADYGTVALLCFGAVLGHIGGSVGSKLDQHRAAMGEAAMAGAILAAACK